MYFVPDDTQRCGFYECSACGRRFLDVRTAPMLICPYCGEEPDMELGPDDVMVEPEETTKLLEIIEGEDVEKYDTLLSLALTGGDFNWI